MQSLSTWVSLESFLDIIFKKLVKKTIICIIFKILLFKCRLLLSVTWDDVGSKSLKHIQNFLSRFLYTTIFIIRFRKGGQASCIFSSGLHFPLAASNNSITFFYETVPFCSHVNYAVCLSLDSQLV